MHILDYLVYLGQYCSHIIGKTSYDQPPSARHTLEIPLATIATPSILAPP